MKKTVFWRGISIIPKTIILKQENGEYDVDHNLLIKDINNIMLKGTSLENDLEFIFFSFLKERNQVKIIASYTVLNYH